MTMTLISSPSIGCARSISAESVVAHVSYACVMAHADAAHAGAMPATAPTTATNLWLGGAVQSKGSGSKFATKRFVPGRLEGMT